MNFYSFSRAKCKKNEKEKSCVRKTQFRLISFTKSEKAKRKSELMILVETCLSVHTAIEQISERAMTFLRTNLVAAKNSHNIDC